MQRPPLRILIVVNLPWDARLGAVQVWMELAEQWRAMGHTVERFTLSDAFPGVRAERVTFALRQLIFMRRAAGFVRRNSDRFDVIDALIGALPFAKEELGFGGIIVARSVGLYRLYERFEQSVRERWPQPPRGKLIGRLFYSFTRQRLRSASERAVRTADLVNVPNKEEAACLRDDLGVTRILVQPYGLTEERRQVLESHACDAATRLAQRRVCFIGMWSARKGAYDWAGIIAAVRRELPHARFRFLGTMVDAGSIERDLGAAALKDVELVSDYEPPDLPRLLADCTVGAFPSYAEGFGLAVIEQLAARLPTVAYDTAGPRDILSDLPELLVPSGDIARFGAALVRLLRLDAQTYANVAERSSNAARKFSWPVVARDTIRCYAELLAKSSGPILFVQPFSLGCAGGGARILRALTDAAPLPWRSVCSSPAKPKPWRDELHLRSRPPWGRIEHSRLAALPQATAGFFAPSFRVRLRRCCETLRVRAIHAVPHSGLDFAVAHQVARDLSLPFFLSLHDDLAYTATLGAEARDEAMGDAWRSAAARFVISAPLGREYCRRYGERPFQVVTDGLTSLSPVRVNTDPSRLRIYFMGLFHMSYERNLRALLDALAVLERERPDMTITVTLRCEHVRPQVLAGTTTVKVLPFADEAQVQRDLADADLLYMPIPFGAEHERFARYSLSTKMVTYVGSGVPILYHGPENSAAGELLRRARAAVCVPTLEPTEIAAALRAVDSETGTAVASNALALAAREFMLADQRRKFWGSIADCVAPT
ncbi:MAG TPA: glycosyltransferase [Chthoniobacterales bacterium]|nr:glycosyltransferase [Chthoniobacterales bacterium]